MRKLIQIFKFRVVISLLLLSNALIAVDIASAQNSKTNLETTKITTSKEKLKEIIKLDLEMTKSSTNLLKDASRYNNKFLYLHEKLAALSCFPESDLEVVEPECQEYINALKSEYPEHPLVICQKAGLNSKLCFDAYKNQLIVSTTDAEKLQDRMFKNENFEREQEYVDLELKLDKFYLEDDLVKLRTERDEKLARYKSLVAMKEIKKTEKEELQKLIPELRLIFKKIIPVACRVSRTVYVLDAKIENRNIFYMKPSKATEDLSNLLAEIEKTNRTPSAQSTIQPKGKLRIRVLSDQCLMELKTAIGFDSELKEIYCFHDGLASPRCRNALKVKSALVPMDKSTKQIKSDSLSSF